MKFLWGILLVSIPLASCFILLIYKLFQEREYFALFFLLSITSGLVLMISDSGAE